MNEFEFDEDWMIQLNVRPNEMSFKDPPKEILFKDYSRLYYSILSITISEKFVPNCLESYLMEHIEMEKFYSEETNIKIIWPDEISLTLCFLTSLAHHGDYQQEHLLKRYFHWWMNGYMCPAGLCFTPSPHIKKSIDLFGESQSAESLGFKIDFNKKTSMLIATPSSLIRLSPIAYFYRNHSSKKRFEIIEDCSKRMFGNNYPREIFISYIELLVQALNGISKEILLKSNQFNFNSNDSITKIYSRLIFILSNDKNEINRGINLAFNENSFSNEKQFHRYMNPQESDSIILLLIYLQISSALYNQLIPNINENEIYAKNVLQSIIKWIIYQSEKHLLLIQ